MKTPKKTIKKTLQFIWKELKPYKFIAILQWTTKFLQTLVIGIIVPLYIKDLFDIVSQATSYASINFEANILPTLFVLAGLWCLNIVFVWANDTILTHFHPPFINDIYKRVFHHLQEQSFSFFESTHVGGLTSKTTQFAEGIRTILNAFEFNIVPMLTIFFFSIGVLFVSSPTLALIFGIWTILSISITIILMPHKMDLDSLFSRAQAKVIGTLSDIITNTLNVKVFAKKDNENKSFMNDLDTALTTQQTSWYYSRKINTITSTVSTFSLLILLGTGFYLWSTGVFSVGTIVLLQAYIFSISRQLETFTFFSKMTVRAFASCEPMIEILETIPDIEDPAKPEAVKIKKGEIAFNNVSFAYNEGKDVFEEFSLTIPSGQRVGLVGQSGSGKSTITKLILRFIDPQSGSLTIDGQDISHIRQEDLRRHISYVPQEPMLFHRTIAQNIGYAKPDATQKEIEAVSKKAHAHDFIMALPQGYNTVVGERGMKLSGGERQRVAIARAMLKDSPILVLDEATSALDTVSEKLIQEALWELMKNKTTLVIAHRLSTIQHLDRVVVMHQGAIVQDGSHDSLIKQKGSYKTLWKTQNDGFLQS